MLLALRDIIENLLIKNHEVHIKDGNHILTQIKEFIFITLLYLRHVRPLFGLFNLCYSSREASGLWQMDDEAQLLK